MEESDNEAGESSESSESSSSSESSNDDADSDDEPVGAGCQNSPKQSTFTCNVGDFVAMQSDGGEDTVILFVGKVVAKTQRKLTVHYMNTTTDDYGGCWEFCDDPETPKTPWILKIKPDIIVGNVYWGICSCENNCEFHMTDAQWDRLQILLDSSTI
jgi:hypothetical protein